MTISKKAAVALHGALVFIGTSVASFLVGAFANGVPTTKAAWHGLWVGGAGSALAALFGWLVRYLPTTLPPPNGG